MRTTPASIRAHAEAVQIVHRLQRTGATIASIAAEYGCTTGCINLIWKRRTTRAQRVQALCRKRSWNAKRRLAGKPAFAAVWNKGMRGIHLSPATEFQPGRLRGHAARRYRPIGAVVIRRFKRRDGRAGGDFRQRWIKVADGGRRQDRWVPYARWLWGQHNGPVPAGVHVMHRDGDTLNDAMENLVLVPHGQLVAFIQTLDPSIEKRRRTRASRAAVKRHEAYREAAALGRQKAAEHAQLCKPAPKPAPAADASQTPAQRNVAAFLRSLDEQFAEVAA